MLIPDSVTAPTRSAQQDCLGLHHALSLSSATSLQTPRMLIDMSINDARACFPFVHISRWLLQNVCLASCSLACELHLFMHRETISQDLLASGAAWVKTSHANGN